MKPFVICELDSITIEPEGCLATGKVIVLKDRGYSENSLTILLGPRDPKLCEFIGYLESIITGRMRKPEER